MPWKYSDKAAALYFKEKGAWPPGYKPPEQPNPLKARVDSTKNAEYLRDIEAQKAFIENRGAAEDSLRVMGYPAFAKARAEASKPATTGPKPPVPTQRERAAARQDNPPANYGRALARADSLTLGQIDEQEDVRKQTERGQKELLADYEKQKKALIDDAVDYPKLVVQSVISKLERGRKATYTPEEQAALDDPVLGPLLNDLIIGRPKAPTEALKNTPKPNGLITIPGF